MLHSYGILLWRALAAECLILAGFYISYGAAFRLAPGATPARRWCAACVVGMGLASATFNLLLAAGWFRLTPALLLTGASWRAALQWLLPWPAFRQTLARDWRAARRTLRFNFRTPFRHLHALARELGAKPRYFWVAAFYVMFLPALRLAVGSGYVEPGLNLALVLGILFGVRSLRGREGGDIALSLTAFGVAAATKITAAPLLAVAGVFAAGVAVFTPKERRARLGGLCLGTAAIALIFGPWILRNIRDTGRPLGVMPVSFADVTLGRATPALEWYQELLTQPATLMTELAALGGAFQLPALASPHLSIITVIPLLLCFAALAARLRREALPALFLLALTLGALASYYHPGFAVVRIKWSETAGRFLLPLVCPAVAVAVAGFGSSPV